MTIGERIKARRRELNMTQAQLANKIGVSYQAISKYENGVVDIQDLPTKRLSVIASALETTPEYLMGVLKSPSFSVLLSDEVEVSEIAQVAAGFDKAPLSNFEYDKFAVPRSYLAGHDVSECFIVRVKGDSMYPLYIDGDRVLSRRADALDYSGEIGIVQDGETATIKKVEFGSGWLRLVPINPAYAPRTIKGIDLEQVRIIGIPMVLVRELEER